MKKTVLALSFALCASFAFAQTKNVTSVNRLDRNQAMEAVSMDQLQDARFNASIFTKDDPEPFKTWDFSTDEGITLGIVEGTTGDSTTFTLPDGTTIRQANHANTNDYSKWRRLTSYSDPILDNSAMYPFWSQLNADWRQANGFTMLEFRFDTARTKSTGHNGLMFMSMSEGSATETQPLNAYVDLGTVSTEGKVIVDLKLFQFYRNYYDECYIDYSEDGTNWKTLPINVDDIDVVVNGSIWGRSIYTLPVEAAGKANLHLRLRYYSFGRGSALGYWWAFDDVELLEGEADRWERWTPQYVEGAYQMMPKGLDLPLLWYSKVRNNGVEDKTGITTNIYNYDIATQEATSIMSETQADVVSNPMAQVSFVMDPAGWATNADGSYLDNNPDPTFFGWYGSSRKLPGVTGKGLNTVEAGEHYAFSTINSNAGEQSFDTICYRVTEEESGDRVWGHDNGILSRFQFFGFGVTDDGFLTDTGHFANANYRVTNRYTTGATIPEGWVLRGMEMVVTTEEGMADPYTTIIPLVFTDEYDGTSITFNSLNTGAGEYVVQVEDFDPNTAALEGTGYLTPEDDYKTIRIMFPEQPELEPYTSYRVGYQMAEAGQFAVAANSNRYYVKNAEGLDSVVFYSEDPALEKYASFFGTVEGKGVAQNYSTLVYDPMSQRGWHFAMGLTGVPMIRAIVGPRVELPTYGVTINCEGNNDAGVETGIVTYGEGEDDVCGSTVNVAEGSFSVFYVFPAEGYQVSELKIDGTAIDVTNDNHETDAYQAIHFFGDNPNGQHYDYWAIEFRNVTAAHALDVKYAAGDPQGIDPIAPSVRMKLQPNPATSQVRLSLSGVEGMVNCSLIDMSGRVVYNTTMDAENAEVIDLSNVAKGAYFVRITNNQFSKIEKLIVR